MTQGCTHFLCLIEILAMKLLLQIRRGNAQECSLYLPLSHTQIRYSESPLFCHAHVCPLPKQTKVSGPQSTKHLFTTRWALDFPKIGTRSLQFSLGKRAPLSQQQFPPVLIAQLLADKKGAARQAQDTTRANRKAIGELCGELSRAEQSAKSLFPSRINGSGDC